MVGSILISTYFVSSSSNISRGILFIRREYKYFLYFRLIKNIILNKKLFYSRGPFINNVRFFLIFWIPLPPVTLRPFSIPGFTLPLPHDMALTLTNWSLFLIFRNEYLSIFNSPKNISAKLNCGTILSTFS